MVCLTTLHYARFLWNHRCFQAVVPSYCGQSEGGLDLRYAQSFHHLHRLRLIVVWSRWRFDNVCSFQAFSWIGYGTVQIDKQDSRLYQLDRYGCPHLLRRFVPRLQWQLHQTSRRDLDQHHQPILRYCCLSQKPIPARLSSLSCLHSSWLFQNWW